MRAAVLGAGSFGTAMAQVLVDAGHEVRLWARDPALVANVNERHENSGYLPGLPLSPALRATTEMAEALQGVELVVMGAPSTAHREVMSRALPHLPAPLPIVTVAKGIENGTLLTMTEVLASVLPPEFHGRLAVLSGPSFAKEILRKMPTLVTAASGDAEVARFVRDAFRAPYFRAYDSTDVVGVQLGGALKNVIAIAAGASDGLGLGHNTRAALITRGLAEISRVAVKRGAHPLTLAGLAGMGDLVLTCTGELSRNRTVGFALGQGRSLADILSEQKQVAEGVKTALSAKQLSDALGVEMPISSQIHAVVHEGKPAKQALSELMRRDVRSEL